MREFGLRTKAALGITLLAIAAMTGCTGLSTPPASSSPTLSFTHSSVAFGSVAIGKTKTITETITNSSPVVAQASVMGGATVATNNITILQISSSSSSYSVSGISLPATLAPGQSATFTVKFTPKVTGTQAGTLSVNTDATEPMTLSLMGTGATPSTIAASRSNLSFGSVQTGTTGVIQEVLSNSGTSTLNISSIVASGTGFSLNGVSSPIVLEPGQTVAFNARFSPTGTGSHTGSFKVTSDASNSPLTISATGNGVADGGLTASPASVNFGTVQVGVTQSVTETLTNSGGSSLTISAANLTGGQFSISGLTLPVTLNAGQSASFSVKFKPTATGSASGSIAVTSDGSNPNLAITLTGSGVTDGALSPTPSTINFGTVVVGGNQTVTESLTNSGGSNLKITAASASGAGFSLSGLALPTTLGPGQSTSFSVKFAAGATGNTTGDLTITSDGSNPTLTIPLTGNGVADGALTANPSSLNFGSVDVGSNLTKTETLTNSGGSNLKITAASASGAGFSISGLALPVTLNAGQSVSFSVKFVPTTGGNATGGVTITSDGSNPTLNIPLSGTGFSPGTAAASPTSLSFGSVQVGNSSTKSETLTNNGGSSITVTGASSTSAAFSVSGLSLPTNLAAGQSVTFSVVFSPTASGSASGNLTLTSNASNPSLTVALSGTGTTPGQLAASPASQNFGSVVVGSSASKTGTLSATGSSVQVTGASSDNPEFRVTGITFPTTIAAGGTASFTVTFTPSASGASSGVISFASNATNTASQSLTGSGTAPAPHSVDLSWTASTGSGIVGYNVYRGTRTGGPYTKVNSSLNIDTTFTDSTVVAGTTYFYVVTAVDGSGTESGYSNEARAVVPSP